MAQQQFNTYKGKHNVADIDTALDRVAGLDTEFAAKQAKLVSGTNIKTVNNQSILGSGNIEIETTVPTASAVGITTIDGLTATNVQTALAQIYAKAKESGLSDAQIAAAIATYLASHPIEGVTEAPKDGKQYARKDGVWSEVQPSGEDNVQADWNQTDSTKDDYIKNKPTIPNPYTKAEVDAKIAAIQPGMSDAEKAQFQSNTQDIAENKVKIAANSALIASLQQNGLPTGSDYSFTFVEEAVMEGLTAENTTAAVLYFGLEEDENAVATYDSASGKLTVPNGTYDSASGKLTIPTATFNSTTGQLKLN